MPVTVVDRMADWSSCGTPDHCETWYAHLNTIEVHWPQAITSGERLGQMGGTGNAKGWHLHLEVRAASVHIDPWSCLVEQKSHHHAEVME